MDFDFGEVELQDNSWIRESFKTDSDKTLLLDADYIPYTVGFCSKEEEYNKYLDAVSKDPIKAKRLLDVKINHACFLIQSAMNKAGCDSIKLFVTDSKTNFRNNLATHYKEQREDIPKPFFWSEIHDWMWKLDNIIPSVRNEADDMVSIYHNQICKQLDIDGVARDKESYKFWNKYIIGSKDKDVNQVFGWHVDLDSGELYWVSELGELKPKYKNVEIKIYEDVKVGEYVRGEKKGLPKLKRTCTGVQTVQRIKALKGTGYKFFCAQMLMGDPVDNYFGLKGIGGTGTFNLLNECSTIEECLKTTIEQYKSVHGEEWKEHLLLQARYAWMQKEVDELWELPSWID